MLLMLPKKIFHIFKEKQSFMDMIQCLQKNVPNIYMKKKYCLMIGERKQQKRKKD